MEHHGNILKIQLMRVIRIQELLDPVCQRSLAFLRCMILRVNHTFDQQKYCLK
ncbi:hypothetical protein D3C73_1449510 [compost metagenome]